MIRDIFDSENIEVRIKANCIHLERRGDQVLVGVECDEGAPHVIGSHVLLAVGRIPNTNDLNLPAAGITTDQRGYIPVDDELRTTAPGIFAIGDCNGRGGFTHTSYNDYEIVADNLLNGASRRVSDRITAYALYIDPPLARAGSPKPKCARQKPALIGKRPMTHVNRAVEKARRSASSRSSSMRKRSTSSAQPSSAPAAMRPSTPS